MGVGLGLLIAHLPRLRNSIQFVGSRAVVVERIQSLFTAIRLGYPSAGCFADCALARPQARMDAYRCHRLGGLAIDGIVHPIAIRVPARSRRRPGEGDDLQYQERPAGPEGRHGGDQTRAA